MTTAVAEPAAGRQLRVAALDRVRGLAVLLMVVDHSLNVANWGEPVRWTLTRSALPLFMMLAGHLAVRLNWRRLLPALAWGLALTVALPWVDRPNVLVLYVAAMLLLVPLRPAWRFLVMGVCATLAANGWHGTPTAEGYDLAGIVLLLGLGQLTPRRWWLRLGDPLPAWFAAVGRYPLTVYVGHLLVLAAVMRVWGL